MRKPSEIKIGDYTLEEILERHLHWVNKDCDGWENMRANLSNADLINADLSGADLSDANLSNTILWEANLHYSKLLNADLRGVDLTSTNLCNANLRGADLRGVTLTNTNLSYANLCEADLRGANLLNTNLSYAILRYADLRGAENIPYILLACPSEGSFIGWKKVEDYLVKLEIPASAKRCSATTEKCRASKAKVLGIYTLDGEKTDLKNVVNKQERNKKLLFKRIPDLDYIVGETVYPDSFDENRWNECSHGIHFFINKEDAINY